MNPRYLLVALLLAGFTSDAFAQSDCGITNADISYPMPPLTYPMTSDQYAVQYKLGSGGWTDAPVRISYYGGTLASPNNSSSGYPSNTSLSFVSIAARASTNLQLRVTKLGSSFLASDHVSVRPSAKRVDVYTAGDGTIILSTTTAPDFAGDQFLLWWGNDTEIGRASCRESVDLGGRRIIKKKKTRQREPLGKGLIGRFRAARWRDGAECLPAQLRCFYSRREIVFFSSRRRHTRLQGDWSSDVCSSDL